MAAKQSIQKAVIIGAGNLSWSLIPNLQEAGIVVSQLISRTAKRRHLYSQAYDLSLQTDQLSEIDQEADWVFLCVRDHMIGQLAKDLEPYMPPKAIALHSSGSMALDTLEVLGDRIGIFYPLQIFTRQAVTDFGSLPLFIEGNPKVLPRLKSLAERMSPQVKTMDSAARLRMHLGAVMVCNFTNFLYTQASGIMEGDFEVYIPLIKKHLEKVFSHGPENTQTGPAIRGDYKTLFKHLNSLEEQPDLRQLYKYLSKLINSELDLE